jgi:hypothetical protein
MPRILARRRGPLRRFPAGIEAPARDRTPFSPPAPAEPGRHGAVPAPQARPLP